MTVARKGMRVLPARAHHRAASMLCTAFVLVAAQSAQGGVTLENTRVVYPLNEREITFQLDNPGDARALVQVWIDDGNAAADPTSVKVPFLVLPPIFRVEAGRSKALRIIYAGDPLPQDRESVYWLNVLDIPPAVKEPSSSTLGLAFRIRIKLFVRPDGLEGSSKDAPNALRWTLVDAAEGKGLALRVKNPTPFHVSLRSFEILDNGKTFGADQGAMVAPKSETVLAVPALGPVGQGAVVRFVAIDDDSAPLPGQSLLGLER